MHFLPVLKPEDSWVLEVKNTADYYCTLQKVMKGKIVLGKDKE